MVLLTDKERQVYDYIDRFIGENGYPPSVRDIAAHTGIKSTSTVYAYIGRLEEKGVITKNAGKSRALITKSHEGVQKKISVPILGRITAGAPISAIENNEGYFDFDPHGRSYSENELFALKVRGTSMIDAGILDGDIVVVRKTETADNGDIVVALIDDKATVKTYYKEKGRFRLQPQNTSMDPIIVKDLSILGQVIANFRYYY